MPEVPLVIAILLIQFVGYYYANKKKNPRYRWGPFWILMALFYGLLIFQYSRTEAYYDSYEHHQSCGMWVIGFYFFGFIGILIMPLVQLVFTMRNWIIARKRKRNMALNQIDKESSLP